ncbi:MAG: hypothetical protein R2877_02225 [Bdellovibrionota bacterium]
MELDTESVTELKKSAQMDAKLEEPRMNLAQLNMENGNYAEASQLYFETLRANSANMIARQELGRCTDVFETPKKLKNLLSVLQLDPFNAESAYHLGMLYHFYMQDGEKAVEYYQRFLA